MRFYSKRLNKTLFLAITITFCLIITACCQQAPRSVYGSFYKALTDRNSEISWGLIDHDSQQAFANTALFLTQTGTGKMKSAKDAWKWVVQQHGSTNLPDPYDLTEETIEGERAVLNFKGGKEINLVREGGKWKVIAVAPH